MAILETDVLISITKRNVTHFKNKGYDVTFGEKHLVKIEDLTENSGVTVTKICDEIECGKKIHNQRYVTIIKCRKKGDGKDRCDACARIERGKNQKVNVPYERSLECYAKENNKNYLLSEFSSKNNKLPSQISYGTNDKYWWNCPDCNSEYDMKVSDRTSGKCNCPFCHGIRINNSNSLLYTHPEIAKLLKYQEKAKMLTSGSNKKEEFVCPDCGLTDKKVVFKVVNKGYYSCKRCGDTFSFPEKFMFSFLSEIGIDFVTQKTFDWSNNKKYDFYVPSKNLIIETHGEQHYEESFSVIGGRTLLEEQKNDEMKQSLALSSGEINQYIIINCSESNMEFIKKNILNSSLSEIFYLSEIDWVKCNEYAASNLVKETCNHWVNGMKNTMEISCLMKIAKTTVIKFLKQGKELGWCDYDPKEEMRKSGVALGSKQRKEIVQLTLDGKFIRNWKSAIDASESLNILRSKISLVCTGKRNQTGGFRWMFLSDYIAQTM
jgi:hypothetical protein